MDWYEHYKLHFTIFKYEIAIDINYLLKTALYLVLINEIPDIVFFH